MLEARVSARAGSADILSAGNAVGLAAVDVQARNGYFDGENFRGYSNRGRLTTVTTARIDATPLTSVEYDYDPLGRVMSQRQRGWLYTPSSGAVYDLEAFLITNVSAPMAPVLINQASSTYMTTYSYNLAGALTSQTYPSGHSVTYNYDAAGRLADKDATHLAFTGNLGDGTQRTYSTGILYSPFGGMTKEQFGTTTPVYNKLFYNSRGQLSEIRASTSYTGPTDTTFNRGAIINDYNTTDNNGNLRKQTVYIPNNDQNASPTSSYQQYDYDSLNRLQRVHEYTADTNLDWQQEYVYDRYGNRTIHQTNTWPNDNDPTNPLGTNIPRPNFGVDPATNRLTAPPGKTMSYDAAGNLTFDNSDGIGGARTYDAENRMTHASANDQQHEYTYDGEGRRVRRKVNGVETWQVYGLGGELIAEYAANGAPHSPLKEYGYRNGQLLVTAAAPVNVALASAGSSAVASTEHSSGNFPAAAAINGDRTGATWGTSSGGWNDNTRNAYPDMLEVGFAAAKTIDQINVFTLQNNWTTAGEPTPDSPATGEGILDFIVQYWCENNPVCPTTPAWTTVTGGNVTGNDKAWRQFTFPAVTTSKIRVVVNNSRNNWTRIVEVEAYESGSSDVQWLVADQLGTPRMVFEKTGSLTGVKRHDYLPFGEILLKLGSGLRFLRFRIDSRATGAGND